MELGENWKLKHFLGASEMAQWENVLTAEPDPLNLILGTYTVERENSFWQDVL